NSQFATRGRIDEQALFFDPLGNLHCQECLGGIKDIHCPAKWRKCSIEGINVLPCSKAKIVFIQDPQRTTELLDEFSDTKPLDGHFAGLAVHAGGEDRGIKCRSVFWKGQPCWGKR